MCTLIVDFFEIFKGRMQCKNFEKIYNQCKDYKCTLIVDFFEIFTLKFYKEIFPYKNAYSKFSLYSTLSILI